MDIKKFKLSDASPPALSFAERMCKVEHGIQELQQLVKDYKDQYCREESGEKSDDDSVEVSSTGDEEDQIEGCADSPRDVEDVFESDADADISLDTNYVLHGYEDVERRSSTDDCVVATMEDCAEPKLKAKSPRPMTVITLSSDEFESVDEEEAEEEAEEKAEEDDGFSDSSEDESLEE